MKIIVPVKRVIDAQVHIQLKPDASGIMSEGVKTAMNPFCRIALEEAIRIREKTDRAEIIVLSVGKKSGEDVLRNGLAMGADRAMLIEAGGELQPIHIARILAAIADREKPDLYLLGKQSIDGDHNQTGQMLAAMLGWPQGTFASGIEMNGTKLTVTREVDAGLEVIDMTLPAVITADLRLNEPRYVNLPEIMKARNKPLDIIRATDLDVDLEVHQQITRYQEPPSARKRQRLTDTAELLDKLRTEARVV